MTRKLLIMATNNEHKLKEVRQILDYKDILIKGLEEVGCYDDIPETADTLEGNALLKARYMYSHYGVDCFADDTGLEVEALDGQPGVFTARFGQMNGYGNSHDADANMQCLLDKLQGKENRKARFRTVIALVCEGKEYIFEGIVEGEILTEKSGQEGFGYDPIFFVPEKRKTFSQLTAEEKNEISHRGVALRDFAAKLENYMKEN